MKLRKTIAIALIAASISPVAYAKDATYMEEGSSVVIMNGNEKDIEKNVINVDGTAYVPLRALSDVLGYNVYWKDGKIVVGEQSEKELSQMNKRRLSCSKI